jgi:hypothetical protein
MFSAPAAAQSASFCSDSCRCSLPHFGVNLEQNGEAHKWRVTYNNLLVAQLIRSIYARIRNVSN